MKRYPQAVNKENKVLIKNSIRKGEEHKTKNITHTILRYKNYFFVLPCLVNNKKITMMKMETFLYIYMYIYLSNK